MDVWLVVEGNNYDGALNRVVLEVWRRFAVAEDHFDSLYMTACDG